MVNSIKKKIFLFELSDIFDGQVYLPYSSGVVWSYLNQKDFIKKNYELKDWFFAREKPDSIIKKIKDPDILLFSCFMWNWSLNCEIAKEIKKKYPKVIVIFGGQHQPLQDRNKNFFKEHPFVDILSHHEGELTLEEILSKALKYKGDKKIFKDINGSTLNLEEISYPAPPRKRMSSIEDQPSPFLDGSFDFIVKKNQAENKYNLHATLESARGCPFGCAFCEIGDKYYQKIKTSYSKTKKEIDWISNNKIEYVTDANSNYGILFEDDYDLAKYVCQKKAKTGYPKAYRVTWAKGQADKVLKIAKLLEKYDLQKGMTIALQSMSQKVLDIIKRKNVSEGKLQDFISKYEKENISSYVELIWGLPGETIDSFKDGVMKIIEMEYHNYLDIHLMMVLPNAPICSPGFLKDHKIEVSYLQPRFSHRSNPTNLVKDLVGFVTQTNTCTREEWIEGHQFRWLIIFSHYLGCLQYISRGLNKVFNISYRDFYFKLFDFSKTDNGSLISNEYKEIKKNLLLILRNERHWGDVIENAGDINWEVDEATCIRLLNHKEIFYKEIKNFILENFEISNKKYLDEIFRYQKIRINDPHVQYPFKEKFDFNIHDVIENNDEIIPITEFYTVDAKNFNNTVYNWAKEVLWFGRRTAKYKTKITKSKMHITPSNVNEHLFY